MAFHFLARIWKEFHLNSHNLISFLEKNRGGNRGSSSLGKRRWKGDILKCIKGYYKGNVELSLFAGGRIKMRNFAGKIV